MIITPKNFFFTTKDSKIYVWLLTDTTHNFHTTVHLPETAEKLVNDMCGHDLNYNTLELEEDDGYFRVVFHWSGKKFHTEKLNLATALWLKRKIAE